MNREAEKAAYELEIFNTFLNNASLAIESDSISNGDPNKNEPDILCVTKDGNKVGFELGRLIDPNLARVVNRWEPQNAEYVRTSDPSAQIARQKIKKTYSVSHPVELILYKEFPIITPDDTIIPTIEPICHLKHEYSRVWFMGDTTEVLYVGS